MRSLVLVVVLAAAVSASSLRNRTSVLPPDVRLCQSIFRPNDTAKANFQKFVTDCKESVPGVKEFLAAAPTTTTTTTEASSSGTHRPGQAHHWHGPENPFKYLDEKNPALALELRKCIAKAKGDTTTDASGNVVFNVEGFKNKILASAAGTTVEAKVIHGVKECSTESMKNFQAFPFVDCVKLECVSVKPA